MPPRGRKLAAVPEKAAEKTAGLAAKVQETLDKLELRPEDAALAALALEYGRTVDRAAAIAAQAAKIPFDPDTAEAVEQLRKRVTAHATMADLGPKILAVLDALGATPKARAQSPKATGKRAASALQAMRGGA